MPFWFSRPSTLLPLASVVPSDKVTEYTGVWYAADNELRYDGNIVKTVSWQRVVKVEDDDEVYWLAELEDTTYVLLKAAMQKPLIKVEFADASDLVVRPAALAEADETSASPCDPKSCA